MEVCPYQQQPAQTLLVRLAFSQGQTVNAPINYQTAAWEDVPERISKTINGAGGTYLIHGGIRPTISWPVCQGLVLPRAAHGLRKGCGEQLQHKALRAGTVEAPSLGTLLVLSDLTLADQGPIFPWELAGRGLFAATPTPVPCPPISGVGGSAWGQRMQAARANSGDRAETPSTPRSTHCAEAQASTSCYRNISPVVLPASEKTLLTYLFMCLDGLGQAAHPFGCCKPSHRRLPCSSYL